MIVSIHQPDYIPWLGFFYKVAHSNVFVYLDDAQFSNEAAHNYNVIKTPQGELRMRIPVRQKLGDLICEVGTKDELNWKKKHLKTLEMNYKKARYFSEIFPGFREVLLEEYPNLAEMNIALNQYILDGFGIRTKIRKASDMQVKTRREERVIDICLAQGGDEYLSGNGARAYQEPEHFSKKGVRLTYLDYKPIVYEQLWKEFLPCMSVIDYIFNCGFNWEFVEREVEELNK